MAHAQGILNLLLDVIDYPGRTSRDGQVLLVVDFEIDSQYFCFGWIEIDLLLDETVNIIVVDPKREGVLWMGLVIGPNFRKGRQAAEGNGEGKDRVFRLSLLSSDDVFAHC